LSSCWLLNENIRWNIRENRVIKIINNHLRSKYVKNEGF